MDKLVNFTVQRAIYEYIRTVEVLVMLPNYSLGFMKKILAANPYSPSCTHVSNRPNFSKCMQITLDCEWRSCRL